MYGSVQGNSQVIHVAIWNHWVSTVMPVVVYNQRLKSYSFIIGCLKTHTMTFLVYVCRIIGVTSDAVLMIINKFSELILACKGKKKMFISVLVIPVFISTVASPTRKRWRLSSSVDREQQLVCYKELHGIQQSLHARLNTNQDSLQVANKLRKVHAALIPFKRL